MEVRQSDPPRPEGTTKRSKLSAILRAIVPIVAVFCALCLAGSRAEGQTIVLSLGSSTITFPNASPASSASIAATENPVSISVTVIPAGTNWTLTALANGDLTSGGDAIAISNVTWTATGAQFVGGTLSKTTSQAVASGPNSRNGTLSFSLANLWTYSTGTYSQTITFTATTF